MMRADDQAHGPYMWNRVPYLCTYIFRNFIVAQCHTTLTKVLLNRCNLWEMLHPIFYPFENSMHRITGLETSQKSGFALVKIPLSKELVYIF